MHGLHTIVDLHGAPGSQMMGTITPGSVPARLNGRTTRERERNSHDYRGAYPATGSHEVVRQAASDNVIVAIGDAFEGADVGAFFSEVSSTFNEIDAFTCVELAGLLS